MVTSALEGRTGWTVVVTSGRIPYDRDGGGGRGRREAGGIVVVVTSAPTHEVPKRQRCGYQVEKKEGRERKREETRATGNRKREGYRSRRS